MTFDSNIGFYVVCVLVVGRDHHGQGLSLQVKARKLATILTDQKDRKEILSIPYNRHMLF